MEEKYNESTINRPEGDRILDAPLVTVDLYKHIEQIKEEETWRKNDRNAITLFKTDDLRIVLIALHASAEVKPATPSEGITSVHVLEGQLHVVIEDQIAELKKGQLVAFHEHLPFKLTATEETTFLLTMTGKNANKSD
jgi:mannose-6-phosphate isomerase class I